MATYVNDLRLKEIATGDESGTWGTSTNTNLELIGEALGFGTEAITTNADTHTTTVADGATDPGRAMYLKYTGTLDSACTITIAPNTISRMQFIENGTSGSQNIIISQGSGANITIPPGDTKAVYLDGAGSGAAVVDAFASLNTVDLKVEDDLTVTDDASVGGDLLVSGEVQTANIGFTDGDNAITISDGGGTSFAQALTANAGVVVDNITIDGTEIDLSSGDLTLDVAGDIILDADGGDVRIADGGTNIGALSNSSSDFVITSSVQDKDIKFNGDDGGSGITALTLDMSEAGAATFNDKIIATELDISGDIDVDGTTNLDVVDIDGAVDMASTLQVDGAITTSSTINGVGIKFNVTNFSNSLLISNDAGTGTLSTANNNTGLGHEVFNVLTSGDQNTAVGANAMDATTEGSNNTALGYEALGKHTTGTDCTGVGRAAMLDNTTGSGNCAFGVEALENGNGCNNTVAIGKQAGRSISTGSNNMLLGTSSGNSGSPGGAITSGNNEVTIGNGDHSKINVQVSLSVASDERDKTDFQPLSAGLDFVNQLTPYTYYWDKRHKYVDWDSNPDTDLNNVTHDGTHKEDWLDLGFKAQDVVALEESINHKISNKTNLVSNLSGDGKQYALQYEKFVPILVKALQEADDKIDALTARVAALES